MKKIIVFALMLIFSMSIFTQVALSLTYEELKALEEMAQKSIDMVTDATADIKGQLDSLDGDSSAADILDPKPTARRAPNYTIRCKIRPYYLK